MSSSRTLAFGVPILLALSGCVEPTVATPGTSAAAEIARLTALGFRPIATGATTVLTYSGPINRAVTCRSGSGAFGFLAPDARASDGSSRRVTLDAILRLTPGADGVLAASERDGLYAVTIATRAGPGRPPRLEGITFGPGESATFQSGLTCRST